jgi:hypothetical protein
VKRPWPEKVNWLREKLLVVVGGNFYLEPPGCPLIVFEYYGRSSIWLTRDEDNYLGLNIDMTTTSGEERISMEENYWMLNGEPDDFECPPSGRLIHAHYANGDELRIEFREIHSEQEASERYNKKDWTRSGITFPITAVEVQNRIAGTRVSFDKDSTSLGGLTIKGSVLCVLKGIVYP